jgi:hypothetical protein
MEEVSTGMEVGDTSVVEGGDGTGMRVVVGLTVVVGLRVRKRLVFGC